MCLSRLPAGGQGAITPDDVAQAVLFCFRLSKNAVPEEVGGEERAGWVGGCMPAAAEIAAACFLNVLGPTVVVWVHLNCLWQIVLKAVKPGTASA